MQAPALMLICASWCRIQQQHGLHKAQLSILSVHMWFELHVTCPQILVESPLVGMNVCAYKHIHTCVQYTHHMHTHYIIVHAVMCTPIYMQCQWPAHSTIHRAIVCRATNTEYFTFNMHQLNNIIKHHIPGSGSTSCMCDPFTALDPHISDFGLFWL